MISIHFLFLFFYFIQFDYFDMLFNRCLREKFSELGWSWLTPAVDIFESWCVKSWCQFISSWGQGIHLKIFKWNQREREFKMAVDMANMATSKMFNISPQKHYKKNSSVDWYIFKVETCVCIILHMQQKYEISISIWGLKAETLVLNNSQLIKT